MKLGRIISYTGVALLGFCTAQTYNYLDNKTKNHWQQDRILENKKEIFKTEGMDGINKTESLIEASSKDLLNKEGRTFIIWEEMADRLTNMKQYYQGLEDGKQMLRDSLNGKDKTIIKTPKEMPNIIIPKFIPKVKKGFEIVL